MKRFCLLFSLVFILAFQTLGQQTSLAGSWYVDEDISEDEVTTGVLRIQFTFNPDQTMDMVLVMLMQTKVDDGVTMAASLGGDVDGRWTLENQLVNLHLDESTFALSDSEVEFSGLSGVDPTGLAQMRQAVEAQLVNEFDGRFRSIVGEYAHTSFEIKSMTAGEMQVVDAQGAEFTFIRAEADQ